MSAVRLWMGVATVAAAILLLIPVLAVARRLAPRLAGGIPVATHALFLRVFAVRVTESGRRPVPGTPTLVVANHVSWLDIPVLASRMPLSFVAKREVGTWPVVGALARLQRCVFIDRARRAATADANAAVAARLAAGDVVVLFPEGTTGDGTRLLPFRSSLVGAARSALAVSAEHRVRLQPLAIRYRTRAGLPLTRGERPLIAWYGDMDLLPHASALLRGGPIEVDLVWGDPVTLDEATSRKAATAAAERAVRDALAAVGRTGVALTP